MPSLTVKFAGELFEVAPRTDFATEAFMNFVTDETGGTPLRVTDSEKRLIRQKFYENDKLRGLPPQHHGPGDTELRAYHYLASHYLLGRGVLLVHGSAVVTGGRAYLFIAPSGTGKSTHTQLWCEALGENAFVINDDKQFLQPTPNGVLTYATPWGMVGKPQADSAPLEAIVSLTRGSENRVRALSDAQMLLPLYKASLHGETPQETKAVMELLQRILSSVKLYAMTCTPDITAAKTAIDAIVP